MTQLLGIDVGQDRRNTLLEERRDQVSDEADRDLLTRSSGAAIEHLRHRHLSTTHLVALRVVLLGDAMHPEIGERRVLEHVADVAQLDQRRQQQLTMIRVARVERRLEAGTLTSAQMRTDTLRPRLMIRHVGRQYGANDQLAHLASIGRRQRRQYVTLALR